MRALRRLAFLAMLLPALLPTLLQAGELRVCIEDRPHPPYILHGREGTVQVLMRMAAARSGLKLQVDVLPIARCRENLRRNAYDMMAVASHVENNIDAGVFPLARNGEPDKTMAAVSVRLVVLRRIGSNVDWDGQRFSNLNTPVLTIQGQAASLDVLKRANVKYDDGAREMEQALLKLVAGRGDALVILEDSAQRFVAQPNYADKIEILPRPLVDQPFYFIFSRGYFDAHRADADSFWHAVARLRPSAEYHQAVRDIH